MNEHKQPEYVYLVYREEHITEVIGVYGTKEKAEAYARKHSSMCITTWVKKERVK